MQAQLALYKLDESYRRFPAADGNSLGLPNPVLMDSEIGCFISHYLVLRDHLGSRSHIHILEDDSILSDVMPQTIARVIDSGMIDEFDFIATQTNIYPRDMVGYKRLFENSEILRDANGRVTSFKIHQIEFRSCTSSYIVNRKSIPKILTLYEQELHDGARQSVDLFLRSVVEKGKLRGICLFPFITTDSPALPSIIGDRPGGITSRTGMDLVRRSFFIDHDLQELARETRDRIPYKDADMFAQILSRNLHFMMTSEYNEF